LSEKRPLIALTGATGFIGRRLLEELLKQGFRVRVLLRRPTELPAGSASALIGDIASPCNMSAALADVGAVIHSAGIAHAMSGIPADDYRALNTEATVNLARAAERAGVTRFVFLSSIRAQIGQSAEQVLTEDVPPQPTDAYGRSKLEAEQGLAGLGIDWVALRPVLVYGSGARGNLATLMRAARSPWPLPLGGLNALRSLLSVDNLADAVATVLTTPGTLQRALIVADSETLTLPEMIGAMRSGLGRRPGVLPAPPALKLAFRAMGQEDLYHRFAGSLVADASALRGLGWTPRIATQEGLARIMREP
jgi:UDP-glucose 4-epimerase